MAVSVRLDPALEQQLRDLLEREDRAMSDFVRQAVQEKLAREATAQHPYDLGKSVFGRFASEASLSHDRKQMIREKMRARHRRG